MYKRIATSLQEGNIMLARLHFIVSIANLFKPFLTKFQSESVSIHLLFEELAQVLRLLLQRFVKVDALKDRMVLSYCLFHLTVVLHKPVS